MQTPATHFGVLPLQSLSDLQPLVDALGRHAPFTHEKPAAHGVVESHPATHCPLSQILPGLQSLEYLHVSLGGVHEPPAQTRPPVQSMVVVQGHGPLDPPHGWHWFATQALPEPQSAFVVHGLGVGGWLPGGTQRPDLQTSPCGQSASV